MFIPETKVKCPNCGDTIFSSFSGQFVHCSCRQTFIDETEVYCRIGGDKNTAVVDEFNQYDREEFLLEFNQPLSDYENSNDFELKTSTNLNNCIGIQGIDELQNLIDSANEIVFFGGAGVSTESGIPDFRGPNGIFKSTGNASESMLTLKFLEENPEWFYWFFRSLLLSFEAEPNAAHQKLAELERAGKHVTIVTQNIDGLHQKAKSRQVIELHGGSGFYCINCKTRYDLEYYLSKESAPHCLICNGLIRPDVVFYGERLNADFLDMAMTAIERADLLIVAGTSLIVAPAHQLVDYYAGENLVIINNSETDYDKRAKLIIREPVGHVLSQIQVR